MHERLGGAGGVVEGVGVGGKGVHVEWTGCKGNLLYRSENGLSEQENGPIRAGWVGDLDTTLTWLAPWEMKCTCLLH
jgi:hypothetical protein